MGEVGVKSGQRNIMSRIWPSFATSSLPHTMHPSSSPLSSTPSFCRFERMPSLIVLALLHRQTEGSERRDGKEMVKVTRVTALAFVSQRRREAVRTQSGRPTHDSTLTSSRERESRLDTWTRRECVSQQESWDRSADSTSDTVMADGRTNPLHDPGTRLVPRKT